jgi:hypothetical protein
LNGKRFLDSSSAESEASVNEIQWVPGFIRLTRKTGVTYWIQIAEIIRFDAGEFDGTPGSYIELRGREEGPFTLETPDQIGELIRQEWEGGVSLRAEIQRAVESGEAA